MPPPSAGPPDRPSTVLLGGDAGGSHCTVVIGTADLKVLGRADGPAAAMKPGAAAASAAVLVETARRAAGLAGLDLPAERAVIGAAGAGRPQEQAELAAALVQTGLARQVRVVTDAEASLATAFVGGPGILVSAGTGSIAYARDPGGRLHSSGGHGWQVGDEGGGYWLGRRALAAAARAHDGRGEATTLLARVLSALGVQHFGELVRWASTATPAQVAALAPQVLTAAGEGDAVARRALADAARELVDLVAALERYFPDAGPIPVAATGGVLRPQSPLLGAFGERLAAEVHRARLVLNLIDTPVGALKLAAEEQRDVEKRRGKET